MNQYTPIVKILEFFLKMQHVFDTSNFSLKYVKQILGLFTRLCIFCDLTFQIWSKILIKLKVGVEIPIGPNPYLDH